MPVLDDQNLYEGSQKQWQLSVKPVSRDLNPTSLDASQASRYMIQKTVRHLLFIKPENSYIPTTECPQKLDRVKHSGMTGTGEGGDVTSLLHNGDDVTSLQHNGDDVTS